MKQKNIPLLGAIYDLYMTTAPVASGIVGLFSLATFYAVVREHIIVLFPWMSIGVFFMVLAGVYLLGMAAMYGLLYASWFTFRNQQEARHGSIILSKLSEHDKTLEELKNLLTALPKSGKGGGTSQNTTKKTVGCDIDDYPEETPA